jgi:signal transduction histidine kinase
MGLTTMAERASSLQAELEVRSAPGAGTVVRVTVPIADEEDVSVPTV